MIIASYADSRMLSEALLSLGSWYRFNTSSTPTLACNISDALKTPNLPVQFIDYNHCIESCGIDIEWVNNMSSGDQHAWRKLCFQRWLAEAYGEFYFLDADTITVQNPKLLKQVKGDLIAMYEPWMNDINSVMKKTEFDESIHKAFPKSVKEHKYWNIGFLYSRKSKEFFDSIIEQFKKYHHLIADKFIWDQTLINLICASQNVQVNDFGNMVVGSYNDLLYQGPPPVIRHFFGNKYDRLFGIIEKRHPELVKESADALEMSVGQLAKCSHNNGSVYIHRVKRQYNNVVTFLPNNKLENGGTWKLEDGKLKIWWQNKDELHIDNCTCTDDFQYYHGTNESGLRIEGEFYGGKNLWQIK